MIVSKEKVRVANSKDASDHIMQVMGKMDPIDIGKEHFWVIHLNARNTIISVDLVAVGCATSSLVHPREVFRRAVTLGSIAVIFSHNHPSGDPTPSPEDQRLTERLVEAGNILGIKVLDHVIVGTEGYISMMESMPPWK
jgi:DNA repair protein RadC